MNRLVSAWRGVSRPARPVSGTLMAVLAVVATGVIVGLQYAAPDKRVIAVLVAMILAGLAWRADMIWGLGLLVLTVPYPRGTVFGNSNVALILVLLVIWLLRITQRESLGWRRTPLDVPIAGFAIAWLVSMYNLDGGLNMRFGLENTQMFVACVLMFYLIVGNVRTSQQLQRFHLFQVISLVSVCLLGVYELNHPGQDFIPGWIHFRATHGDEFDLRNVRIGGPFFDYELFAEFAALSILLVAFLFVRATTQGRRLVMGGIFVLNAFILFSTVTRGAFFALGAAAVYLFWITRRHVQFVPLVIGAVSGVALFLALNTFVATQTRSGDLLQRISETQFVGLVPDSRQTAWRDGWERFLEHPIIGHGPYYAPQTGTRVWFWPHNGYLLVANYVGLVGLTFYLLLLGRLLWISRPKVDSLRHPSYAASFLIIGHLQLVLFVVDQIKIDFLRSEIYLFEVWITFAGIVSAYLIWRDESTKTPAVDARGGRPAEPLGAHASRP